LGAGWGGGKKQQHGKRAESLHADAFTPKAMLIDIVAGLSRGQSERFNRDAGTDEGLR